MNNTWWTFLILYQLWFRDFQVVNINCKFMDLLAPNSFKIITNTNYIISIIIIIPVTVTEWLTNNELLLVLFNRIAIK